MKWAAPTRRLLPFVSWQNCRFRKVSACGVTERRLRPEELGEEVPPVFIGRHLVLFRHRYLECIEPAGTIAVCLAVLDLGPR